MSEYCEPKSFKINLPHTRANKSTILDYFEINDYQLIPRKDASCKYCGDKIEIIAGTNIYSSYTLGLNFHLKKHPAAWQDYLSRLSYLLTPDTQTIQEHAKKAKNRFRVTLSKEESSRNFREVNINSDLNRKSTNIAGVCYNHRDCEVLSGKLADFAHYDIARILRYLHPFTNKDVHIFDLVGTKHENAPLRASYKMSKCLVNNDGDITLDLQRLLCKDVCYFDPELYGECSHGGGIELFHDEEFQNTFQGFKEEIEKYPEFQVDKSFNSEILNEVRIVEHDKKAVMEMRRMVIIILTMIVCQRKKIEQKIKEVIESSTDENNIRKPDFGIFLWGPKNNDVDANDKDDETVRYDEKLFYTHIHKNVEECPAYNDGKKAVYKEVFYDDGKAYYPCNIGGCCSECQCIPCNSKEYREQNSFKCPEHSPDHPEMFDESEDLFINRRIYFLTDTDTPIYERPKSHRSKCPPMIKFAKMKQKCKFCRKIFNDHRKHHHVLHEACQLCNHMHIATENSFSLTCHICFKTYSNKYRMANHMNSHKETPTFYCDACNLKFARQPDLDKHMRLYHTEVQEVYNCTDCPSSFSLKDVLNRHIRTKHTQIKEFECDTCGKHFNRHDNLLKHKLYAHNSRRNLLMLPGVNDESTGFNCLYCERVYSQKFSLMGHMESKHIEDKFYKCDVCDKSFVRKDVFLRHLKIHI